MKRRAVDDEELSSEDDICSFLPKAVKKITAKVGPKVTKAKVERDFVKLTKKDKVDLIQKLSSAMSLSSLDFPEASSGKMNEESSFNISKPPKFDEIVDDLSTMRLRLGQTLSYMAELRKDEKKIRDAIKKLNKKLSSTLIEQPISLPDEGFRENLFRKVSNCNDSIVQSNFAILPSTISWKLSHQDQTFEDEISERKFKETRDAVLIKPSICDVDINGTNQKSSLYSSSIENSKDTIILLDNEADGTDLILSDFQAESRRVEQIETNQDSKNDQNLNEILCKMLDVATRSGVAVKDKFMTINRDLLSCLGADPAIPRDVNNRENKYCLEPVAEILNQWKSSLDKEWNCYDDDFERLCSTLSECINQLNLLFNLLIPSNSAIPKRHTLTDAENAYYGTISSIQQYILESSTCMTGKVLEKFEAAGLLQCDISFPNVSNLKSFNTLTFKDNSAIDIKCFNEAPTSPIEDQVTVDLMHIDSLISVDQFVASSPTTKLDLSVQSPAVPDYYTNDLKEVAILLESSVEPNWSSMPTNTLISIGKEYGLRFDGRARLIPLLRSLWTRLQKPCSHTLPASRSEE